MAVNEMLGTRYRCGETSIQSEYLHLFVMHLLAYCHAFYLQIFCSRGVDFLTFAQWVGIFALFNHGCRYRHSLCAAATRTEFDWGREEQASALFRVR